MAVLAIDTSAAVAVSLCDDDGALLAARSVDSARQHAELLAPMIRDVLAEQPSILLRHEIYVTAAALSAGLFVGSGQFRPPSVLVRREPHRLNYAFRRAPDTIRRKIAARSGAQQPP